MAHIIFLGTASSIPTPTRDNTAFVFSNRKEIFLIDCPGAIGHKLAKAGIDYAKLNKVIITHEHPDHVYGIVHLIHAQYRLNTQLTIFTNPPTKKLIKKLLRAMELEKAHYPRIKFIDALSGNYFYSRQGLKIGAVKSAHITSSFGVKFLFGKKSLLYSSDTKPLPSLTNEAKKSTYLIHDCTGSSSYFKKYPQLARMHTDSKTLCDTFRDSKIKKIIPVHFLLLRKGEEQRIKKELSPLGNKLYFPHDFDRLNL